VDNESKSWFVDERTNSKVDCTKSDETSQWLPTAAMTETRCALALPCLDHRCPRVQLVLDPGTISVMLAVETSRTYVL
jgi:hypothetical protein